MHQVRVSRLTRWKQVGDVVQLVRTLPCHGRGREFESRRPRHILQALTNMASIRSGDIKVQLRPYGWPDPTPTLKTRFTISITAGDSLSSDAVFRGIKNG